MTLCSGVCEIPGMESMLYMQSTCSSLLAALHREVMGSEAYWAGTLMVPSGFFLQKPMAATVAEMRF